MSLEELALLRTLVVRPITTVPASCASQIERLVEAGYAVRLPEGWTATALGCALVQERRTDGPRTLAPAN